MRLRCFRAGLTRCVLAAALWIGGSAQIPAQTKEPPSDEIAPYSLSVRTAYTVRPNYLVDFEETAEYRIGTRAAAEELAQQRVSVNEHFRELQIIEAVTLKADGRRLPVPADKIMTKASSDDGEALFDADETIRIIIFPDVAPGDRTRYVVRYRAKKPSLPGGFELGHVAAPSHRYSEYTVTLDAPVGMRLHTASKGFEHREVRGAKRVRHEWALTPLPYRPSEPEAVSLEDRGPYLRVSSFADLAAAGAAFCGRAEPRSAVTPAIMRQADDITRGKTGRRDQARAIFDWVASNIRYVAITRGAGGMVPHTAGSILENRYGDCKDHTTLMRALLAAKGIKSEYASINDDPVYKTYEIPYQGFDHVILYLPEFDLYADPTPSYSTFERLPYYLADKPVLRCGYGSAVLSRVPPSSAEHDTLTVTGNLRIGSDGRANGETVFTGTGAGALRLRHFMEKIERSGAEEILRPLFDELNLNGTAQFERRSSRERHEPYTFKMTYTISDSFLGARNSMELITGPIPVHAPYVKLKPVVRAGRIDDFTCHPISYREDITYTLPQGWTARVPDDVSEAAGPAEFSARYARLGQVIEAHRIFILRTPGSVCQAALAGTIAPVVKAALHDAGERLKIEPAAPALAGR